MKLIDYLNDCKDISGKDIAAIRYYYDSDSDGYESEDINIINTHLIFEELCFELNTEGKVVDGVFQFVDDLDGVIIGIETLF